MSSDAVVEGISGAIGASVALTATYPLLAISTQAAAGKNVASEDDKPLSTVQTIQKVCREQGWQFLYRGLKPALMGTVISQGVYFYLYAELRQLLTGGTSAAAGHDKSELSIAQSLAIASVAGCGNCLLTNPIWLVVTRMQTRRAPSAAATAAADQGVDAALLGHVQPPTFLSEFRQLLNEGGLPALWRGIVPTLVMVVNPTVQYMLYELAVKLWRKSKQRPGNAAAAAAAIGAPAAPLSSLEVFCLSAAAKLGATLFTYPLLVVKNRIQAANQNEKGHKLGLLGTFDSIFRGEGVLGFFAGLRTKVFQSVLAAAIMFALKERLHTATVSGLQSMLRLKA